jgi:glutamine amidotransferase
MVGMIEETAARYRVDEPLNMTICATDGDRIIAARYSSERQSRSLFHTTSFKHLHELYPHNPRIAEAGDDAFMVVSEPLVDLRGAWEEVSESTAIVAQGADVQQRPFNPRHT